MVLVKTSFKAHQNSHKSLLVASETIHAIKHSDIPWQIYSKVTLNT